MSKISVVMSVYNGEKYLRESVDSILNQTFKDFEFIIINDGSTDNTKDILDNYSQKDSRLRVINQENIGLTKSLNKGISLSKGEYIARQDVDDISLPERLAKELEILSANENIDLVGSWYYIIDESGRVILERKLPASSWVQKNMKYENVIAHSSVMFRKSTFLRIDGYDEKYKYGQDWFLWLKMKSIAVIPEMLLKYRWSLDNITHKRSKSNLSKKNEKKFLEHRKLYTISSLLIQQGELKQARELLRTNLYSIRNVFYYFLTFLPKNFVFLYIWIIRTRSRRFLIKWFSCLKRRVSDE